MTTDLDAPTPRLDPSGALCAWANDQDHWVRRIVTLVLSSSRELTTDEVNEVYELFLIEKGLGPGPEVAVPELGTVERDEESLQTLVLVTLEDIKNVNALAEAQRIQFDSELTVLFGQNASGKTGYARILKRAAAARTVEQKILPDAHAHLSEPDAPTATIKCLLGGEEHTIYWANELGIEPLRRISVFDSPAVALHVDDDLRYVYTPAELSLFSSVTHSVQGFQERLSSEVEDLAQKNSFVGNFEPGSVVYPVIETLGSMTDLQELRALALLSEEETGRLVRLEAGVAALKAGSDRALVTEARQRIDCAKQLRDLYSSAARFESAVFDKSTASLKGARRTSDEARRAIFDRDSPFGPPGDHWQDLVVSADAYLKHAGRDDYPADITICPYCHQSLGQDALELLTRYHHFLDDALQGAIAEFEKAVDAAAPQLEPMAVASARRSVTALTAEGSVDQWLVSGAAFVETAEDATARATSRQAIESDLQTIANGNLEELKPIIEGLTTRIEDLSEAADNQREELESRERELRDLIARKTLGEMIPHIEEFVVGAKRRKRLETLRTKVPNVLRSLTQTSKTVSEDIQNRSFGDLFKEECALLRAPPVEIAYQGRQGEAQRHKAVADYRPSAVLSEGEQKVLALADFLAECRMRNVRTPIVFDDPVSSLDYRRSDEVAKRLVELSKTHQIIVFTHNILFATKLLHLRNRKRQRVAFYEVRDEGDSIGVINADVEPRLDTTRVIALKIDGKIESAKTAEGAIQDAFISQAVDLVRKWLEAFVEQDLFAGVTKRFRSNVRLGSITNVKVEKLPGAFEEVSRAFEITSQYTEAHSRGDEQTNVRFTIADLEELWTRLQGAEADFRA